MKKSELISCVKIIVEKNKIILDFGHTFGVNESEIKGEITEERIAGSIRNMGDWIQGEINSDSFTGAMIKQYREQALKNLKK